MVKFEENFEAITIDTEKDEQELVSYYEGLSGKTVYPAQPEKIMLSVIAYAKSLVLMKLNECVKNLLLPYAKGIWLDILGFLVGCERLSATQSMSTLQVNLYETFSFDKTIPAGTEVETRDGEAVFVTTEDLVIPTGNTTGTVSIESVQAGSVLNYGIGEITNLLQNYTFVESVTNITACTGGSDEEDDDDYRERIASAPEQFSIAGPEEAYKYHIKSAHKSIIDCACVLPNDDVKLIYDGTTYTENDGTISVSGVLSATVDYNTSSVDVSCINPVSFKVVFPKQAELNWYILTEDGEASQDILNLVETKVSADNVRPLTDYVRYFSAIKQEFVINPIVYVDNDADFNTVKTGVETALNNYFADLKKKLNTTVLASTLIALIKNVSGVYDVDLNGFTTIVGDKTKFLSGSIGENTRFERVS